MELGVVGKDLINGHAAAEQIKDQGNPDAVPANAGLSETHIGIDGNTLEELVGIHKLSTRITVTANGRVMKLVTTPCLNSGENSSERSVTIMKGKMAP